MARVVKDGADCKQCQRKIDNYSLLYSLSTARRLGVLPTALSKKNFLCGLAHRLVRLPLVNSYTRTVSLEMRYLTVRSALASNAVES